ncbi:hypothetical protein J2W54_002312 [Rhodococcus fascians]|nr:hypothetical protein [Rhodococcus sp. 3258]MDR6931930.1 hypothetical protein [Rhodococcus fascians]
MNAVLPTVLRATEYLTTTLTDEDLDQLNALRRGCISLCVRDHSPDRSGVSVRIMSTPELRPWTHRGVELDTSGTSRFGQSVPSLSALTRGSPKSGPKYSFSRSV